MLITDKTGTLTEGRVSLVDAVDVDGAHADSVLRAGLLSTDVDAASGGVSANAMDTALWESPAAKRLVGGTVRRVATLPFDHARRATSVLLDDGGSRVLVVKGAPEQVLANCAVMPQAAHRTLDALFAEGRRVVAVASRPAPELTAITAADESSLALDGFLVFADDSGARFPGTVGDAGD